MKNLLSRQVARRRSFPLNGKKDIGDDCFYSPSRIANLRESIHVRTFTVV